jgi:hypothetical protein
MSLITERDVQVAKEGQTVTPAEDVQQEHVYNLFEVK